MKGQTKSGQWNVSYRQKDGARLLGQSLQTHGHGPVQQQVVTITRYGMRGCQESYRTERSTAENQIGAPGRFGRVRRPDDPESAFSGDQTGPVRGIQGAGGIDEGDGFPGRSQAGENRPQECRLSARPGAEPFDHLTAWQPAPGQ
jgi:hypothetical protein